MIEVAVAADARYLPHVAACLHSLLEHRGDSGLRAHLLHAPGVGIERLRAFVEASGGELVDHELRDGRLDGLPAAGHISATMWLRIFLPELLPDRPRVLYLDADTIACDDLGPLWATDLGDALVGAVTNVFEPWNATRPADLGLTSYFNSGVLLLNLEAMREAGSTDAVLQVVAERDQRRLIWPDQDALNLVLGGRRVVLHPRWNAMNSVLTFDHAADVLGAEEVAVARSRPGIRHFEGGGPNKPWDRRCRYPGRDEYLRHRAATPWPLRRRPWPFRP